MSRFFVVLFIFFYPIIASYYYYIPPLIAIAAILAIEGYEKENRFMLVASLVYLFNIEVNFSLPLFSTFIVLCFYFFVILPKLRFFTTCAICLRLITVVVYNLLLIGFLISYDYLFFEYTLALDLKLLYNLLFELMVVLVI